MAVKEYQHAVNMQLAMLYIACESTAGEMDYRTERAALAPRLVLSPLSTICLVCGDAIASKSLGDLGNLAVHLARSCSRRQPDAARAYAQRMDEYSRGVPFTIEPPDIIYTVNWEQQEEENGVNVYVGPSGGKGRNCVSTHEHINTLLAGGTGDGARTLERAVQFARGAVRVSPGDKQPARRDLARLRGGGAVEWTGDEEASAPRVREEGEEGGEEWPDDTAPEEPPEEQDLAPGGTM